MDNPRRWRFCKIILQLGGWIQRCSRTNVVFRVEVESMYMICKIMVWVAREERKRPPCGQRKGRHILCNLFAPLFNFLPEDINAFIRGQFDHKYVPNYSTGVGD
jgi:hypothetical protein